ncbi:MAG TPA: redoxin domain-containing protein [Candidatus Azoamicus sp. MARI]
MKNLIGSYAIDFTAPAVLSDGSIINDFNLYNNIDGVYSLLFFYPMDFTFVCPSELIALNNRLNEFNKRNVKIIAISIDSQYVHKAWRNVPIELGGIGNDIKFTLVSDIKKVIMSSYGLEDLKSGVSFRGSIIIDDKKLVRIQHVHDFPIGRNIDEYIRIFDALIFNSQYGNVCPAGWTKGNSGMVASPDGVKKFLSSNYDKL